jgi:hypothetical protein
MITNIVKNRFFAKIGVTRAIFSSLDVTEILNRGTLCSVEGKYSISSRKYSQRAVRAGTGTGTRNFFIVSLYFVSLKIFKKKPPRNIFLH